MSLRACVAVVSLSLCAAACGGPIDPADDEEASTGRAYQGFVYPFVGLFDGKPRIASLSAGTLACPDGSSSTVCTVDSIVTAGLPPASLAQIADLKAGVQTFDPSFSAATVLFKGQFLSLISINPGAKHVTHTFQVSEAWVTANNRHHATDAAWLSKDGFGAEWAFRVNNLPALQIGSRAVIDWSALPPDPGLVDNWVVTGRFAPTPTGGLAIKVDQAFVPYGRVLSLGAH